MAIMAKNTTSTEHTGNLILPANNNRGYFFVVMTSGSGTVEFNGGGGKIPLAQGIHYEPYVTPTGEVSIESTGTYVVCQG